MKIQKVIKCGIIRLTKIKDRLLTDEYENLQRFLRGEKDVRLYSAHKWQAKRYYKKIKPDNEYPISIRKDLIRVERRDTKIAKYWARIPVKSKYGGIWVAIKPHQDIPEDVEFGESKIFRKNGRWFLHLTIVKEVNVKEVKEKNIKGYEFGEIKSPVVIAIDIGDKNPIASVELFGSEKKNVQFLGKKIRDIRTKYYWIRKSIGKKKVRHGVKVIKKIGDKESRKVNDILHKITTKVVQRAVELKEQGYDPIIVFGDVKNIKPKHKKGERRSRKLNRILNSIPTYKIKNMLTYKALWNGVSVYALNEAWTSKTCHICGSRDTVVKDRLFKCKACGLEYNRDLNGAVNIGNRFFGYMLKSGGSSDPAQTLPENKYPEREHNRDISMRGEKPTLVQVTEGLLEMPSM